MAEIVKIENTKGSQINMMQREDLTVRKSPGKHKPLSVFSMQLMIPTQCISKHIQNNRKSQESDDVINNAVYAAINVCHNHPPRTPGDLPPLWGFCILIFPRGQGFFGVGPKGWAFVYKRFLPFLEFSLLSQELATDNSLEFNICCSEILYVF